MSQFRFEKVDYTTKCFQFRKSKNNIKLNKNFDPKQNMLQKNHLQTKIFIFKRTEQYKFFC